MFIHIGNNVLISDRKCVGIFNTETLKQSETNSWMFDKIKDEEKLVVVDVKNNITGTGVSPFTVIKRKSINEDEIVWSKNND